MKKTKLLGVSTPQGESGLLNHDSRYVFNYKTSDRSCEVSLIMPIRAESYSSGGMLNPFMMNMPEGYLAYRIQERFASVGGLDAMTLLSVTGQNQIGRLRFEAPEETKKTSKVQIGRKELLSQSSSAQLFEFLIDAYLESGISGVQPKVMIPDADKQIERVTIVHSDLIVKASGDDYPFLAVNEFLCMSAATESKIDVAPFWLSDDGGLFVMERFDLKNGGQLGFEDMTVLMNKSTSEKYNSSYEQIAKAITLYCYDEERMNSLSQLFEYVALSVMVKNGDAHLKNFGLVYDHPDSDKGPKLSPLFDVVTTSAYDQTNARTGAKMTDRTMALNLNKSKNYPDRDTLIAYGKNFCFVKEPEKVISRIADSMQVVLGKYTDRVENSFLKRITAEWDSGRLSLEPARIFTKNFGTDSTIIDYSNGKSAKLVKNGQYHGSVVAVENGYVIQDSGRGIMIAHDSRDFEQLPQVGDKLDLQYMNGKAMSMDKMEPKKVRER